MATSVFTSTTVTGTSYVLSVPQLQLSSDLSVKDFVVTHDGSDKTSFYTKTSATQISYAGANVVLGTYVQAFRETPLSDSEVTFISNTTALALSNALSKLKKRVDELEGYVDFQSSLIKIAGVSPGVYPILSAAYGSGWSSDTVSAASRSAVYAVLNQILTGNYTQPGNIDFTGTTTVVTPVVTDASTKNANTLFVKNAGDARVRLVANRLTSVGLTLSGSTPIDIPINNVIIDRDSYNTTTFTWTCSATGNYKFEIFTLPLASGGTLPTATIATALIQVNGTTQYNLGGTQLSKEYAYGCGSYILSLNAGDTVKPKILIEPTGGTGYTYNLSSSASYRAQFVITRIS